MAALDTFDWLTQKYFPAPDAATAQFLKDERQYLLSIRNENERLRHIEDLLHQLHESNGRVSS